MASIMDRILQSFLERQYQDALTLAAQSDMFTLLPFADTLGPPQLYRVLLYCKGLVMQSGRIVEAQQFDIGIRFNDDHLRRFDPTMVSLLEPLNVWHPNILGPAICVGKMAPGVQLKDLIHQLYEIVTYQNWASHDGLNGDAMQWARNNQSLFPVDRRPLKRRAVKMQVSPIAVASSTTSAPSTVSSSAVLSAELDPQGGAHA